jgi:hypothetical protein
MGSVISLDEHRRRRAPIRPQSSAGANVVACSHCGEPHPIVRLRGGEQRCVTAFFDGTNWFCRNRGCRRAWLERGEG